MLEVREIHLSEHFGTLAALAHDHWLETEQGVTREGPAPNIQLYTMLEHGGALIAFAAFEDGQPVGYVVGIFSTHLHYSFPYVAHDLLYLSPEHRRGSLGLRLMQALECRARERGARFITWHAKPETTFDALLKRASYEVEETIYKKEL